MTAHRSHGKSPTPKLSPASASDEKLSELEAVAVARRSDCIAMLLLTLLPGAAALMQPLMARHRPARPVRMVAADPAAAPRTSLSIPDLPMYSGLEGKAMTVTAEDVPTKKQIRDAVPAHCFKRAARSQRLASRMQPSARRGQAGSLA